MRCTTTPLVGMEPFMRTKSIVNSCMLWDVTAKFAQVPPPPARAAGGCLSAIRVCCRQSDGTSSS